jgi:SAM-dependent methyltransferase
MNTELFTGKAQAYANARPGYPDAALDYIKSLVPAHAVFADIGAGTGKFTELLAREGFEVYAVEPNSDMRKQLADTMATSPNVKIIDGTAEATTLPDHSVDVITCAQSLHWFDPDSFRLECRRIGKDNVLVIAVYNDTPSNSDFHGTVKLSTDVFYTNPSVKEFPNPIFYTRESWLQFMHTHSHSPLPDDPQYAAYMDEANAIFDRENVDGLLKRDVVTKVYWEVSNDRAD